MSLFNIFCLLIFTFLVWRQLNEETLDGLVAPKLLLNNNGMSNFLGTILNHKFRFVFHCQRWRVFTCFRSRVWRSEMASSIECSRIRVGFYNKRYLNLISRKQDVVLNNKYKFVRVQNTVSAFDKTAKPIWQAKLASDIEWQGIVSGEKHVIAVGKAKSGGLRIRFFSYADGKEAKLQSDDVANEKFIVKE